MPSLLKFSQMHTKLKFFIQFNLDACKITSFSKFCSSNEVRENVRTCFASENRRSHDALESN